MTAREVIQELGSDEGEAVAYCHIWPEDAAALRSIDELLADIVKAYEYWTGDIPQEPENFLARAKALGYLPED